MKLLEAQALDIIANPALTHEQALHNLSNLVGLQADTLDLSPHFLQLKEEGLLCDMGEGYMPYAPRYILPDYDKLMKEGCKFLRLETPRNLREAIKVLLVFYRHVPSVTHYPVYLGSVDKLLEPFIEDEDEARVLIEDFLFLISRTIPDSYCHMNLGPEATRAGWIILQSEIKTKEAIPSITLLYDEDITPDDFAELAVECALLCAKPSFANHKIYSQETPYPYGIASCYNALPIKGGAFTLSRLVLSRIANKSNGIDDFFDNVLPDAAQTLFDFVEKKIKFLVEESHFFSSNFLVTEGFLQLDHFTGMIGVVGLCECVNILNEKEGIDDRYGHSPEADALGKRVMAAVSELVKGFKSEYGGATDNQFLLHAQVGIDSDIGISPGVRIAIGDEPDLYDHIRHAAQFHAYFPSGVGDIFPFEETAQKNPKSILDIIKGAFETGMKYFSTYSSDSDVVRITGYLVKRSDIEKLAKGTAVPQANATWGLEAVRNNHALDRKVRSL